MGNILADKILGNVNQSGKITTNDYIFMKEFENFDDTNYLEGVYVGYRYFNSAGIKPLFHFGYGKSYTFFDISKISLSKKKNK